MDQRKKPFIITFAHEKGGTGKSTLATHLATGLMYFDKNLKIAALDLDSRQLSCYNFFLNRSNYNQEIKHINYFGKIDSSSNDSKKLAYQEDFDIFRRELEKLKDYDYIIVDTAGSYSNLTVSGVFFSDLLITPVTESHFDIDAIIQLKKFEKNILNGPFYEIVFEQRKSRQIIGKEPFQWITVVNRASSLYQENSENCKNLLENISKNLDFEVKYIIKDRNVYKELCKYGLTIFDLPHLTHDISLTKMRAHAEMDKFVFTIMDLTTKLQIHHKSYYKFFS